jgi:division protein CdvB (Snf7/Vps24/ESCRT-III family)
MPNPPVSLTVKILKEIRDEVRATNQRLDATNQRLDAVRTELGERIVESELRTATAITDLATTVRDMTTVLRAQADLKPRVERCEQDIRDLRARLPG